MEFSDGLTRRICGVGAVLLLSGLGGQAAAAQAPCVGPALTGVVRDTTGAVIAGAAVQVDGGAAVVSGSDGRFAVPCTARERTRSW